MLKVEKKNYPQVYLEQCKYKLKKRKTVNVSDAAIEISSDHDYENK